MSTPKQEFEKLFDYIIDESERIDKDAPWQEREPDWWVMMSALQGQTIQYKKNLDAGEQ